MKTVFNRRRALGLLAGAGTSLATGSAWGQAVSKIAFVHRAGPADYGVSFEHQRGVAAARTAYEANIQIDDVIYDPAERTDVAALLAGLVREGYGMIFTTSYADVGATTQAAFAAPDVMFESCGGYLQLPNLSTYDVRRYEGRAIAGFLAGTMTESKRIGYLAPSPQPDVICGINAAYQAAKTVTPDIAFDIVWLSERFDEQTERDVTSDLIDRGCDVLLQHRPGRAMIEVAQQSGRFAFGQSSDMAHFGPDVVLASAIDNWGPYYTRRVGAFLDGSWAANAFWGGLADETVAISDLLESIPNSAHTRTAELIAALASGRRHTFEGPINKQNGAPWLSAGQRASDAELLRMNYYLEGNTSVYPSNI